MHGNNAMYNLKKTEHEICKLADTDPSAAKALQQLHGKYGENARSHSYLIQKIYMERKPETIWKLANGGNISESTAYRYRHIYIGLFYDYYGQLRNEICETRPQDKSGPNEE